MHRFSAVRFVKPHQLGTPLYFAPGLAVLPGAQGRNLRLQVVAHGPIAAAINAAIAAETTPPPAKSLDMSPAAGNP